MNMPMTTNKPTFAQIQEEIAAMLAIPDDELDDAHKKLMDAYLDELGQQEADKVDSFAQFLKLEGERARLYRDESQRLAAKARTAERRIDYLKSRYKEIMLAHNLKKVRGNVYTLSLRKSESVDAPDVWALPEEYRRQADPEPDKKAIKAALDEGREVPGARLIVKESLQIR